MQINEAGTPADTEITILLNKSTGGDNASRDRLAALLYPDLKRIAVSRMRAERADHTLQPTALVNELYLQLLTRSGKQWNDRNHFLLVASKAMKRMLVDHARAKNARKRGGGHIQQPLEEVGDPYGRIDYVQVLEVDQLLTRLAVEEPRMASVVELRFFLGLTFNEIGEVLAIDARTAKRDWALAREWFKGQWGQGGSDVGSGMGED